MCKRRKRMLLSADMLHCSCREQSQSEDEVVANEEGHTGVQMKKTAFNINSFGWFLSLRAQMYVLLIYIPASDYTDRFDHISVQQMRLSCYLLLSKNDHTLQWHSSYISNILKDKGDMCSNINVTLKAATRLQFCENQKYCDLVSLMQTFSHISW